MTKVWSGWRSRPAVQRPSTRKARTRSALSGDGRRGGVLGSVAPVDPVDLYGIVQVRSRIGSLCRSRCILPTDIERSFMESMCRTFTCLITFNYRRSTIYFTLYNISPNGVSFSLLLKTTDSPPARWRETESPTAAYRSLPEPPYRTFIMFKEYKSLHCIVLRSLTLCYAKQGKI